MKWDIFHAYDIRGIYPEEVNEETYYRIAKGYVSIFRPTEVVVGMDVRQSSPPLMEQVIAGLLDAGVDVIDIGPITTDMLYFAVGAYGYSGGMIISASHNPGKYNGLKMVRERVKAISSDTGLFEIRDALKADRDKQVHSAKKGSIIKKDIIDDYLQHVLNFIDTSIITPFSIVGNANFGYVCHPVQRIVDTLHLTLVPLNFEPDGTFPKGPPDPLQPANQAETTALIKESKVDFGVAWDADADRAMFFDEQGTFISGAYMCALLAKIMLGKYGKRNKIIFDPRVIWPIIKVTTQIGGTPIMSKGGHAFMKDRMRNEDALFAGEMSAHYYFRDNYYADNGLIPFLLLLEYLSKEKKKLSELIAPIKEGHYMSGELNYRVADINKVIDEVKRLYKKAGQEDFTDGYSVETEEWRFNIRPSNTEPLLRLNIEAKKEALVEKLIKEIESLIKA